MKNINQILFDIDRTTFNTGKFIKITNQTLSKIARVSPEDFNEVERRYLATLFSPFDFDPQTYTLFLSQTYQISQKTLLEAFLNHKDTFIQSLYSETLDVFKALKSTKKLGIFSEGVRDFQLAKLKQTGMLDFIDSNLVFIFRNKITPEAIHDLPDNSLVIDDKPEKVSYLIQNNIQAIWINRKSKELHPIATTISSLRELMLL